MTIACIFPLDSWLILASIWGFPFTLHKLLYYDLLIYNLTIPLFKDRFNALLYLLFYLCDLSSLIPLDLYIIPLIPFSFASIFIIFTEHALNLVIQIIQMISFNNESLFNLRYFRLSSLNIPEKDF